MCGFAGFVDPEPQRSEQALHAVAEAMADPLRHRGPDDAGTWADAAAGAALGHRRLAILDLSPAGHQPMLSADGRHVIAYNGEVYNAPELRAELEAGGHRFRGHSDTEVLLEGFAAWGAARCLARLIGMFAFAIFDRRERVLTLARDRLGIKPLYWGRARPGGALLFGSELGALRAHPDFAGEIDRDALAAFAERGYVPCPRSIYRGISKLPPAHCLTLRPGREPELARYWDLAEVAERGVASRFSDAEEAAHALETLLADAVRGRMLADVPLGAFLSGGIDSSTVVALMQAQSDRPVRTFSIGFHEPGFDEATHAKAVAGHLGTDHTELYVEPRHVLDVVPRLPDWFDEPFSDPSQIPTYLVSEMTRRHVTVALSGDGGDELFAGYVNYGRARDLWARMAPVPGPLRRAAGGLLARLAAGEGDGVFGLLPAALRPPRIGHRVRRLASLLACDGADAVHRRLGLRGGAAGAVLGAVGGDAEGAPSPPPALGDPVERMAYGDLLTYLPDDILTKVDRASMAVALEARVPILDHRVVELSFRVPPAQKIRDGEGKWLLRRVLHRHVPRELVERPKMGFGVPVGEWLRGPLREWAESLLAERRLRDEGYFEPAPIRRRWAEHLARRGDWDYALWDVLMFQAWCERAADRLRAS